MSVNISKIVIVLELLFLIVTIGMISSAFPNNKEDNLIKQEGNFEKLTGGKYITIYLLDKSYDLHISGAKKVLLNYDKLKKLKSGDKLYYISRKKKPFDDYFNNFFGHLTVLELSAEKYGTILSLEDYIEEGDSFIRILLKYISIILFSLLSMIVLYSWWLLFLLWYQPEKYKYLINNTLVAYKIEKGKKR